MVKKEIKFVVPHEKLSDIKSIVDEILKEDIVEKGDIIDGEYDIKVIMEAENIEKLNEWVKNISNKYGITTEEKETVEPNIN